MKSVLWVVVGIAGVFLWGCESGGKVERAGAVSTAEAGPYPIVSEVDARSVGDAWPCAVDETTEYWLSPHTLLARDRGSQRVRWVSALPGRVEGKEVTAMGVRVSPRLADVLVVLEPHGVLRVDKLTGKGRMWTMPAYRDVKLSPGGDRLAVLTADGTLVVLSVGDQRVIHRFACPGFVFGAEWKGEATIVLAAQSGMYEVPVRDASEARRIAECGSVHQIAAGNTVLVGVRSNSRTLAGLRRTEPGRLILHDLRTGKTTSNDLPVSILGDDAVRGCVLSADDSAVLIWSDVRVATIQLSEMKVTGESDFGGDVGLAVDPVTRTMWRRTESGAIREERW